MSIMRKNSNLGQVLEQRRKAKRLTLKQLASESGVSVSHLGRIEGGKRFPSARVLRKLAAPLDFTEVELLKLAGFLSKDSTDDRIEKVKAGVKLALSQALTEIEAKIDSL